MISRIATALRRHQAYNRTTRELSRLSDRELSDLGISRCDIGAVARSAL
jgi:uncharacterized protein YjiS (DUF1127 family)